MRAQLFKAETNRQTDQKELWEWGVTSSIENPVNARPKYAVLDGDNDRLMLLIDMLSYAPIEVTPFSRSIDLLKSAELLHFKIIVMEISLPDIDGFDLMNQLVLRAPNVPLLLVSAHSYVVLEAAKLYGSSIGLNISGILPQPFSKTDMLSALGLNAWI